MLLALMNAVMRKRIAGVNQARAPQSGSAFPEVINGFRVPRWWECSWRRVSCGEDGCRICGKIKQDRLRHVAAGEDPDDPEHLFADVRNSLQETLQMVRKHAEEMGIDIVSAEAVENVAGPPEPHEFPCYNEVARWYEVLDELVQDAKLRENYWLFTEAAADLLWYRGTLLTKTYRQLCTRWDLDHGEEHGDVDYHYTKYALGECFRILKNSFTDLSTLDSPQQAGLRQSLVELKQLEESVLGI